MRRIALPFALVIAVGALAALHPSGGAAKDGSALYVTPDTGELGTTVQLGSDYWSPNAGVEIYAGFSLTLYATTVEAGNVVEGLAEPAHFWGPIAVARSDAANTTYGSWSVSVRIDSTAELPIPKEPGFIIFKAVTEGRAVNATVEQVGQEDETNFALEVDGRRPDGAGGINLTVSVASGIDDQSFLYDIEGVGSGALNTFYWYPAGLMYSNHTGAFQTARERLPNGDYYVFVFSIGQGRDVIGPGQFEAVPAQLCFAPPMGCNTPGTFIVKGVSVRAGAMTNVPIMLGRPGEAPPLEVLPAAGGGPGASGNQRTWALIAAMALLGSAVTSAAVRLRSGRAPS